MCLFIVFSVLVFSAYGCPAKRPAFDLVLENQGICEDFKYHDLGSLENTVLYYAAKAMQSFFVQEEGRKEIRFDGDTSQWNVTCDSDGRGHVCTLQIKHLKFNIHDNTKPGVRHGVHPVQPKVYMTDVIAKIPVQSEPSKLLMLEEISPFTCSHFDGYGIKDVEYHRLVDRIKEGFHATINSVYCTRNEI